MDMIFVFISLDYSEIRECWMPVRILFSRIFIDLIKKIETIYKQNIVNINMTMTTNTTSSMVPSNSKNKLPNTNYDIITNALIYKHLNPPHYRTLKYNGRYNISCLGTVLNKMVRLTFDVQGKGKITQTFLYDIHNKIIKYKEFYYSETQRKKDMKQKKKKKLGKAR